jgi:DNA-binding LytR/AlgR family response regulator
MKLLIIEDEPLAVVRLLTLLREIEPEIQILGSLSSIEESVNWLENNPPPDLILMDVSLADGYCFDILSIHPISSPVIFITAYDQFAIEAFKVFSIDYLLKPVTKTHLEKALQKFKSLSKVYLLDPNYKQLVRLVSESLKEYKTRFLIRAGKRMFFIQVMDIAYFQAEDKIVYLITLTGEKWIVDYSLEKLEEVLDPKIFFRINRKIIGRILSIKEIKSIPNSRLRITLQAGKIMEEAIISREKVQKFKFWAEN